MNIDFITIVLYISVFFTGVLVCTVLLLACLKKTGFITIRRDKSNDHKKLIICMDYNHNVTNDTIELYKTAISRLIEVMGLDCHVSKYYIATYRCIGRGSIPNSNLSLDGVTRQSVTVRTLGDLLLFMDKIMWNLLVSNHLSVDSRELFLKTCMEELTDSELSRCNIVFITTNPIHETDTIPRTLRSCYYKTIKCCTPFLDDQRKSCDDNNNVLFLDDAPETWIEFFV